MDERMEGLIDGWILSHCVLIGISDWLLRRLIDFCFLPSSGHSIWLTVQWWSSDHLSLCCSSPGHCCSATNGRRLKCVPGRRPVWCEKMFLCCFFFKSREKRLHKQAYSSLSPSPTPLQTHPLPIAPPSWKNAEFGYTRYGHPVLHGKNLLRLF